MLGGNLRFGTDQHMRGLTLGERNYGTMAMLRRGIFSQLAI